MFIKFVVFSLILIEFRLSVGHFLYFLDFHRFWSEVNTFIYFYDIWCFFVDLDGFCDDATVAGRGAVADRRGGDGRCDRQCTRAYDEDMLLS